MLPAGQRPDLTPVFSFNTDGLWQGVGQVTSGDPMVRLSLWRELVAKVRSDDPNIAGIRVGQFNPTTVRLVVDLKVPIRPQVFALTPVAAYKHRLVFDLYPQKPLDPLEALIAERLRDNQAAATAPKTAAPPAAPVPAASAA